MDLDQHQLSFKEEAFELLESLEEALLELERHPDNMDMVGAVFRDLHTIKGSGSMFGFDAVADFSHEIENLFDHVRKGEMDVSLELVNLALKANDHIKYLLENPVPDNEGQTREHEILEKVHSLCPVGITKKGPEVSTIPERETETPETAPQLNIQMETTFRIRFTPPPDVFLSGTDVLKLLAELCAMGKANVSAFTENLPLLMDFDPEICFLSWDIILTTFHDINAVKDVFIFIEDEAEISVEVIDKGEIEDEDTEYRKIGQLLVDRGDISPGHLHKAIESKQPLGQLLVDRELIEEEKVEAALAEQEHIRTLREERRKKQLRSTIRVSSDKLDSLVNLVGELVIMQSNLNQLAVEFKDRNLARVSKAAKRLIWELRDHSMEMRMSPIGTLFAKFRRLVRDLSAELGKEVDLISEGDETELDKTIIDRLNDPLVHLIRNSIDHGIERPEERERKGKNRKGVIKLTASHSGAFIDIRIRDNGAGINVEAVKKRAIEQGLMKADEQLTDREIFAFLFHPGFSTADNVTSVSGRGVGMDVIKKNIEGLRGTIHLESQREAGVTVMLKIPLTLVIIDGLLMKVGAEHFIIPLSQVEKVVELKQVASIDGKGGNVANIHGHPVPFIKPAEVFGLHVPPVGNPQVVIVETESEKRFGILVDKVIGEYQTVIKSLGTIYKHIQGLSGATILGDGTIALILDVDRLYHAAESSGTTGTGSASDTGITNSESDVGTIGHAVN